MVKTDQSYINQYLTYDLVFEACDECERACIEADYLLRKSQRDAYLNSFFEASLFGKKKDPIVKKADTAEDNFFAKIGKAISDLIKKITDFIKDIGAAITGKQRDIDADTKAVNKIIAENPELKNTIVKGIKKEWFTKHDVAAYKNDIVGLINMLDQGKIDNETAIDKFNDATKKFVTGAKDAAVAALTISGAMKLASNINNFRTENKKLADDLRKSAEDIKDATTKSGKNPKSISTQVKILTNALKVIVGIDREQDAAADELKNKAAALKKEAKETDAAVNDVNSEVDTKARQDAVKAVKEYNDAASALLDAAIKHADDKEYSAARGDYIKKYRTISDNLYDYVDGLDKMQVNYSNFLSQCDDFHTSKDGLDSDPAYQRAALRLATGIRVKNSSAFVKIKRS
jgi:hypothetical protein